MQGTIIFYNIDNGSGLILGEDKSKHKFEIDTWADTENMPNVGLKVSYELENEVIKSVVKSIEEPKVESKGPTSIDQAAMMVFNDDENEKLDVDKYSAKTVPNGLIEQSMAKFFSSLTDTVVKYPGYQYQGRDASLDYLKMKRFLFTAYNNMLEIDVSLADESLMSIYQNIQEVNNIYNVYKKSYMYPEIAFTTIFLKQTRYKEGKKRLELNVSEMGSIKSQLGVMELEIKVKIALLSKLKKGDPSIIEEKKELRTLKRFYVDSIDRLGTLREENELLLPVTNEYFELFFDKFHKMFESTYNENIKNLLGILNSMAFQFDKIMWVKAKSSDAIIKYFKDSGIQYPYSSLTFLKYFLKSLNRAKVSDENRELFELLDYLEHRKKREVTAQL